eukprot:CAMPEP_0168612370 /NCGR_PEP_ID=MMETSP0449_2-20121227/2882_1 /TAXON_ID=1082188 /ORGANISM="Strombidium rassoulzadegani, Strain ras09" /LENGTH=149 /DNA_ID=CAMNT_0008652933 /DNA_START=296 /DNA_END=746 /DNA_ORIENTATION=+
MTQSSTSKKVGAGVHHFEVVVVGVEDVEGASLGTISHGGLAGPGVSRTLITLVHGSLGTVVAEDFSVVASEVEVKVSIFVEGELLGHTVSSKGVEVRPVPHLLVPASRVSGLIEVLDVLGIGASTFRDHGSSLIDEGAASKEKNACGPD